MSLINRRTWVSSRRERITRPRVESMDRDLMNMGPYPSSQQVSVDYPFRSLADHFPTDGGQGRYSGFHPLASILDRWVDTGRHSLVPVNGDSEIAEHSLGEWTPLQ